MFVNNVINLLKETVEYQDFMANGITAMNLVIVIAAISGIIQGWGMIKQNNRIWNNKSGAALPLTFFAFQFFYFVAYFIYGFKIRSGALMINNLVGILFVPIIIGLIKFKLSEKGSFKKELIISPFLALIIPCVLFIKEQWSLIAILLLALAVFAHLIFEIIKKKELDNIEPKFIISILLGSSVWLWYGIGISDFGLIVSSGSTILAGTLFIGFYAITKRKFRKSPTSI